MTACGGSSAVAPAVVIPAALPSPAPTATAAPVAPREPAAPPEIVLRVGEGIVGLPICVARVEDFVRRYGKPTKVRRFPGSGATYQFAAGVEIHVKSGSDRVWSLTVRAPAVAQVHPDIVLGKSTAREAQAAFPQGRWQTHQLAPVWWWTVPFGEAGYPEIRLNVERDTSVPQFPLDEARHLDRPIIAFDVAVSYDGCPVK